MAIRRNYWSCTPFADWVRGIKKPGAVTSLEWHQWNQEGKQLHPVRFWISEEALDAVQNFIWWPVDKLYDIKYYINNRWVTRTHALTAHRRDIKPGQWCDVGNRFLPCLFNELVDFVELELAWWHIAWSDKDEKKKYNPPFWARGWFRWRTWRCRQAGLDNLKWQSELRNTVDDGWEEGDPNFGEPTPQAQKALEILALYKWWTEVYPNRPDPHDASGWTAYCNLKREQGGNFLVEDKTPEMKEMSRKALDKTQEIETAYDKEDEEMLIRLIKIRGALWT